jgi:hypothetical protein
MHWQAVDSNSQTGAYVGEFHHLQCKQLYRVSHFNPTGIALTASLFEIII